MAESTLSINRGIIKRELRRLLPYALTGSLTTDQTSHVNDIIYQGERQFYHPTVGGKPYVWSFLTRILSLSISSGTSTYDLPDDFAGIIDERLAFTSSKPWALELVPMEHVLEKIQDGTGMPTGITQPLIAAIQPKSFTSSTGQRQQIIMWPTPTSSLTVTGRYCRIPDQIADDDSYYPMGGGHYSQTLLESCLAAAEAEMNDEEGVHAKKFAERLAASIELDRMLHKSEAA